MPVDDAARAGAETFVARATGRLARTARTAASVSVQSTTSRCALLPPIRQRSMRTGSSRSTVPVVGTAVEGQEALDRRDADGAVAGRRFEIARGRFSHRRPRRRSTRVSRPEPQFGHCRVEVGEDQRHLPLACPSHPSPGRATGRRPRQPSVSSRHSKAVALVRD